MSEPPPEDLKRARTLHPHWDDYEPLIKHMILQKLAAKPTDGADPHPSREQKGFAQ
jgi:hypothetical protein